MDTETLAAITALTGAAKTIIETIRGALPAKGQKTKTSQDTLGLVDDLLTRFLALKEIAFRLHREKAEAIEENAKLRKQISKKEEWAAERERYEYKKLGNTEILVKKEDPDIRICPACFEDKEKAIPLQPHPANKRKYRFCPLCGTVS